MKLRTRLNLIVAGLTAMFVAVIIFAEIEDTRSSVNEEVEAANRVGSQLLGRLAAIYSREGDTETVREFLVQLGHVRANDVVLRAPSGELLYRSPDATYKAGRAAPGEWHEQMVRASGRAERCTGAASPSYSPYWGAGGFLSTGRGSPMRFFHRGFRIYLVGAGG